MFLFSRGKSLIARGKSSGADLEAQAEPTGHAAGRSLNGPSPQTTQENPMTSNQACSEDEDFQDATSSLYKRSQPIGEDSEEHNRAQNDIEIRDVSPGLGDGASARVPTTPSGHVGELKSRAADEDPEHPSDAFNPDSSPMNEYRKSILEQKIDVLSQLTRLRRREAVLRATAMDAEESTHQREYGPPLATDIRDFAPGSPNIRRYPTYTSERQRRHSTGQPVTNSRGYYERDVYYDDETPQHIPATRRRTYQSNIPRRELSPGAIEQLRDTVQEVIRADDIRRPRRALSPDAVEKPRHETHEDVMTADDIRRTRAGGYHSAVESELADALFVKHLRRAYKKSIVDVSKGRVRVNLAQLNRVVLECAQKRLVDAAFDFSYKIKDNYDLDMFTQDSTRFLNQYVSAWKDLELMTETRKKQSYDPFVVSTEYAMQRFLLQEVQEDWSPNHDQYFLGDRSKRQQFQDDLGQLTAKHGLEDEIDKEKVLLFGGGTRSSTNRKEKVEHYTRKVAMAMIGGSFLIAPMLIMVLHPGLVTSLVTTSACIFAFGLVMSVFLDKPFDVLSGTAAYAAVLVVFIGTGGGT